MTKNNKIHNLKKKNIDEVIKMSVDMDIPDVKNEISDEEVLAMGCELAPDDMLDRIKKGIAEKEEAKKKEKSKVISLRKAGKVIGIAAIIFVIAFWAMYAESVKVYVVNIINRITDNSIEFQSGRNHFESYDTEESDAYKDADEALSVQTLKPTYLPDDFIFDKVKIYSDTHIIFVYTNGDKTIRLDQTRILDQKNIGVAVNSNDANSYTIDAQGKKISVSEHIREGSNSIWLSSVWSDNKLIYKVEGDCNKEEFEEFIANLK